MSSETPHDASDKLARVVVVGAYGRLGRSLTARLGRLGPVVQLGRADIDLARPESIEAGLDGQNFEVLILAAAMTAVDACEHDPRSAYRINAEAAGEVAQACAKRGGRMIYISTDYVFDGTKEGSYTEADRPCPASVYGASKLAGEQAVLEASSRNLVARVSWLYGAHKPAFPEWILGQAATHETLKLPGEKVGSPTCAEDVAEWLETLIFAPGGPPGGILHLSNSKSCTWQEWGQHCLDRALEAGVDLKAHRIGANSLADIEAFVAPRPRNSVLDTARFTEISGVRPRPWQEALDEHLAPTLAALSQTASRSR